jgi:hypothetical protein
MLGNRANITLFVLILIVLIELISIQTVSSLHLKGTFKTSEFFKFIARFGFQKTDVHDELTTTGFIYGNITLVDSGNLRNYNRTNGLSPASMVTLAVMDYNYFIDYYNKRRIMPRSSACSLM